MVIKEEEMDNVTTEEASPKKSPKGNNDNKWVANIVILPW